MSPTDFWTCTSCSTDDCSRFSTPAVALHILCPATMQLPDISLKLPKSLSKSVSNSVASALQNGGYAVYNFDTKEPGLGVPDVLLTVKSSPAAVAMYCNPAWVTVQDENNKIAGPLNAIFQSGEHLHALACMRVMGCMAPAHMHSS